MRQGLLSEPQASSGPAAMLLAVSRSPSSIPRWSPCPERCHLPLASLNHIRLSKPQKTSPTASTPGAMPSSPGVPQPHPPLKNSKTSPLASTPGAMSPSSGVPLHPSHKTSKASPTASTERYHLPLTSLNHIHTHQKSPASSYSKDTGLPSVIYKLEMRLELTTPSLRVKCSTD